MLFNRKSFYISWRKDQQKDFFLELILLTTKFWTYKASCLCSKNCEGLRWQVSLYRRKSHSRPLREEEPRNSSSLDPTPARLNDSRDSPQGSREIRSTSDLTHARMLQLQELGLAATVTNALDNDFEPQGFAEASQSEAWMDSMREELSSLINNQTWTLVDLPSERKAICCGWIYKAKKTNTELSIASKVLGGKKTFPETRNRLQ